MEVTTSLFFLELHPENHATLYDEVDPAHGVYTPHCRDETRDCGQKYTKYNAKPIQKPKTVGDLKGITDQQFEIINKYDNVEVKGNQLSYLFYGTSLAETIQTLNKEPDIYNIGLMGFSDFKNKPKINKIKYPQRELKNGTTKYITITKGQFCNYESYSAFNYHIEIQVNKDTKNKNDNVLYYIKTPKKEYSTGLFEYLIKNKYISDNTEIDVCGLVTNICVINTVQQGLAMWNQVYKTNYPLFFKQNNIHFRLLEYASLPLIVKAKDDEPQFPDFLHYPYDSPIVKSTKEVQQNQLDELIRLFKAKGVNDIGIEPDAKITTNDNGIEEAGNFADIYNKPNNGVRYEKYLEESGKLFDENGNFQKLSPNLPPPSSTRLGGGLIKQDNYNFEIVIDEDNEHNFMLYEIKQSTKPWFNINLFGSRKTQTGGHTKRCVCPGCLSKRRCTKKKRKNLHKTRKTSPKKYRKEKRLSKKIR